MLHNPQEREMFPRLTDEDLDFLREYAEEVHLKPGEVFFREGDPAQYFYVVISGQMRITKRINNTETLLTVHQPREFGGSMELLTGAPCVATATAQDDTHLFWMPGDRFRYVLGKRPETMSVIVNAVARRAYDVEAQKQQNEKLTALGRLAAGLATNSTTLPPPLGVPPLSFTTRWKLCKPAQ